MRSQRLDQVVFIIQFWVPYNFEIQTQMCKDSFIVSQQTRNVSIFQKKLKIHFLIFTSTNYGLKEERVADIGKIHITSKSLQCCLYYLVDHKIYHICENREKYENIYTQKWIKKAANIEWIQIFKGGFFFKKKSKIKFSVISWGGVKKIKNVGNQYCTCKNNLAKIVKGTSD